MDTFKLPDTFKNRYTTNEKIDKEAKDETIKDKKEAAKTILSNDAYAISELVERLINKIEHTRCSLM
jgi:hypothetical protein